MKNKRILVILIISLISNVVIITLVGFTSFENNKIGYINTAFVFEKFQYKKDLELRLKTVAENRKNQLDSLEFEIRLLSKKIESDNGKNKEDLILFDTRREEYFHKKEQMEEDNAALARNYDNQIFEQMNQYISDYGQAHNYKYILGNDGSGIVMFARKTDNITNEVIDYINEKYKGIK